MKLIFVVLILLLIYMKLIFIEVFVSFLWSVRLLGDELGFFSSSCFSFDTQSRVNTGWWGYLRRHSDTQVSKAGDQYSGR